MTDIQYIQAQGIEGDDQGGDEHDRAADDRVHGGDRGVHRDVDHFADFQDEPVGEVVQW